MAVPLLLPLQVTEVELAVTVNVLGSDIFHETDEVQPALSVIVVVNDPAHKLFTALVVAPVFQLNEYGLVPPVPSTVICPVQIPLHVSEAEEIICAVTPFKLLTAIEPMAVQALLSDTVTE